MLLSHFQHLTCCHIKVNLHLTCYHKYNSFTLQITSTAAQQILEKALEKGYVDCHIWKVLVTGAAGSGKTTLKYRLFGKDPPSLRRSTALAEAAIRAISREIVGTDLTGWFKVTSDELMELLGGALKGGVPMEEGKLVPGTPEAPDFKQPTECSIPDHSTPSTVAYNTESTSSMPTSKTTEAAVNVPTKIFYWRQ